MIVFAIADIAAESCFHVELLAVEQLSPANVLLLMEHEVCRTGTHEFCRQTVIITYWEKPGYRLPDRGELTRTTCKVVYKKYALRYGMVT